MAKAALIVGPPEDLWGPIQAIRATHDKAYDRWPPHVNVLWPFLPVAQADEAAKRARAALARVRPFQLTLATFGHFVQSKKVTVHLQPRTDPPDALRALQDALLTVFPDCTHLREHEHGFSPHLTVGQWAKAALSKEIPHLQVLCRVIHDVIFGFSLRSLPPYRPTMSAESLSATF